MCVAFAVLFSKAECGNFNFSEVLTDSNFFLLDFSTLFVNVMKNLHYLGVLYARVKFIGLINHWHLPQKLCIDVGKMKIC